MILSRITSEFWMTVKCNVCEKPLQHSLFVYWENVVSAPRALLNWMDIGSELVCPGKYRKFKDELWKFPPLQCHCLEHKGIWLIWIYFCYVFGIWNDKSETTEPIQDWNQIQRFEETNHIHSRLKCVGKCEKDHKEHKWTTKTGCTAIIHLSVQILVIFAFVRERSWLHWFVCWCLPGVSGCRLQVDLCFN